MLRLSDVNMMNDYAEGRWGYRLFEKAANAVLEMKIPGLDEVFLEKIDEIIAPTQLFVHPVICSFSLDPDVLSQWRGYADNGRGVAIGFSAKEIERLPVTLLEVCYDQDTQLSEMKAALLGLFETEQNESKKFSRDFEQACMLVSANSLAYKNPAFSEEKEIRCVHLLDVERSDEFAKLKDGGGHSDGKKVKGSPVCFRVRDGAIVPYIDLGFRRVQGGPIVELWIGPRNQNGPGNFLYPLHQNGFTRVKLRRSEATYRG